MRRRAIRVLAVLIGTALSVLFVEFVLQLAVVASPASAGRLMSVELPPMRIFRGTNPPAFLNPSTPIPGVVVAGVPMTRGDLWGHFRLDPETGYAHSENVTSHASSTTW